MKVIYLAAYKALHPNFDVTYQDINGLRDIGGDMMDVDLTPYDVIIATPPCNYFSKARGNRTPSKYALSTKHLLSDIIDKCISIGKPFIIENVRNKPLFIKMGLYDKACYIYTHGRHTYWTNLVFNPSSIPQEYDFRSRGVRVKSRKGMDGDYTQGGQNVHNVIDYWLEVVSHMYK